MTKHYIDYKAIVWFRIPVDSEPDNLQKAITKLNEGSLPSDLYADKSLNIDGCHVIVEQFMSVNDNDGERTMELIKEEGDRQYTLWDNSYTSELKRKET